MGGDTIAGQLQTEHEVVFKVAQHIGTPAHTEIENGGEDFESKGGEGRGERDRTVT